jgi:serine protein kinase
VLLLHGPVGSSKSTIARLLKRGLELVSRRPEGAVYSYRWHVNGETHACPMHEDPLHLLPAESRLPVYEDLNRRFDGEYRLAPTGKLCPVCRWYWERLMKDSGGDFSAVERAVECYRLFQRAGPRGHRHLPAQGREEPDSRAQCGRHQHRPSSPSTAATATRALQLRRRVHVANRGLIEFVEILKLDVAFLYDPLGATQEHGRPRSSRRRTSMRSSSATPTAPSSGACRATSSWRRLRDRTRASTCAF